MHMPAITHPLTGPRSVRDRYFNGRIGFAVGITARLASTTSLGHPEARLCGLLLVQSLDAQLLIQQYRLAVSRLLRSGLTTIWTFDAGLKYNHLTTDPAC